MRNLLPILGIEPSVVDYPARRIVAIPTVLSWLPMYGVENPNVFDAVLFVNTIGCVK
jgi:hypothetical protein